VLQKKRSGRARFGAALSLALLVGGARLASAGELYSWVDEEGVIHLRNFAPGEERAGRYEQYQGEDAHGFGGEAPLVLKMEGGKERVLYKVDVTRYDAILEEAATHYNLPFAFLKAIAKVESNFNPEAVSPANAKGLMQMIDSTAELMNVDDPFDPRQSIFGGARFLRLLANEFQGDMALTAAAYNAGPERVRRLRRIPEIAETQAYVRRVLVMYRHYRGAR
jgi:hypothetical protein